MRALLFSILLPAFLISCGDSSEEQELNSSSAQDTLRYGAKSYRFPQLTSSAKSEIENWSVYDDFYSEAASMHDLNLENLRTKTDKLLAHTDSLTKKIPDTLYTSAIYSRLVIIETRVKLLQQEVNREVIDRDMVEENLLETQLAVKNLIVQLNEKFQKDGIDMQKIENEKKELEKRKRFLDSVQRAELEDQQKKSP